MIEKICSKVKNECETFIGQSLFKNYDSLTPEWYNYISSSILLKWIQIIEQINLSNKKIPVNENLGVILYTEVFINLCNHYFIEFEKNIKFINQTKKNAGNKVTYKRSTNYNKFSNFFLKKKSEIKKILNITDKKNSINVGCIGVTTFNWFEMEPILNKDNIFLHIIKNDKMPKIQVRELDEQKNIFLYNLNNLHDELFKLLNTQISSIDIFNFNLIFENIESGNFQDKKNKRYDLIISGSQTSYQRYLSLNYQKIGVPHLLFHHGANYLIYDESFYSFYEGALADYKMVYGDIRKLESMNALGDKYNIHDKKINFFSRTDNTILNNIRDSGEHLEKLSSLKNKNFVYLSTSFNGLRYGPYRDVHPIIYKDWQEKLISFIELETGKDLLIQLHPKRQSTKFDPINGKILSNSEDEIFKDIDDIDGFIIDYPSTSLAKASSTNKPIIFFDLGLRKFNRKALEGIKSRTYYNKININDAFKELIMAKKKILNDKKDKDNNFSVFFKNNNYEKESSVSARIIKQLLIK